MLEITIENAYKISKKYLECSNPNKFEHSIRVAGTCKMLTKKWCSSEEFIETAIIRGLLHDIGKSISEEKMLSLCLQKNLPLYDFELFETPKALHGKVGAILFESEFNNKDIKKFNAISHAISSHTTGNETMNLLDKITFIADNIEPKKDEELFNLIKHDNTNSPNEYIKMIIKKKLKRAKENHRIPNPLLKCTKNSLKDER